MIVGGNYTIDFAKVSNIPKFAVGVKVGDSKRKISLTLLENNTPINLNNYTVVVACKKSDGNDIFNDVNIVDAINGKCEVEITEQMLVLDTDLPCEIVLYGVNGVVATSSNFVIGRIASIRSDESIVSSSEFSALTKAMAKIKNLDNKIWSMANMGQDIKEAMTGGSVAVVGTHAVNTINVVDNAITLQKMNLKHYNQIYMTDSIKYKRSTNHLYLPNVLYRVNNVYKTVKPTDFPDNHPNGEFRFWANNLSTLYFDAIEASNGNYPFIWKTLGEEIEQVGDRYITIATIKDSGILTNFTVEYIDENEGEGNDFDISKSRLMLPNKLFMINEDNLNLYKNSIMNDIHENRKITMEFKSDKSYSDGYYEYIEPKLTVDANKVGIDCFIGAIPNNLTWETGVYGKNISIVKKSINDVSNKTPNILFFGDSLTVKGTPSKTKDYLASWGINANMLGSVKDDNNVPCEGRGSRTMAQYIGYRSLETTDDTTPTPVYPFLKVATSQDKANNPTWCFTRTGSIKEQNYNEASNKNQDFYIFDFEHYLSKQGCANPDIVIISMSTNDFWKYDESEATSICKLAYDIMINQILKVCPNCKIGIIPNVAYGNTKNDRQVVSKWNGVAQDYIYAMNKGNVDVIGAWLSQSSDMSFNLSKVNKVCEGGIYNYQQQDTIHPTVWGIKEVSKVIGYYIINQI